MILARYLLSSYGRYFLVGHCSLVFLYTLIEFFEKLSHVRHVRLGSILEFIALNSIPCFFTLFPLSSWLACCLLIKEFSDHERFLTLQTLGINLLHVRNILIWGGVLIFALGFVGREFIAHLCSCKSQQLNKEQFKRISSQHINQKWFHLNEQSICFISLLDLASGKGNEIIIYTRDGHGAITHVHFAKQFIVEEATNTIILKESVVFEPNNPPEQKQNPIKLYAPELCTALKSCGLPLSYPQLIHTVWNMPESRARMRAELTELISRTLLPLQSLLLIALSISLFISLLRTIYIKWLLLVGIYPALIFVLSIISFIVGHGAPPVFLFIPYGIGLCVIMALNKLQKQ